MLFVILGIIIAVVILFVGYIRDWSGVLVVPLMIVSVVVFCLTPEFIDFGYEQRNWTAR